MTQNLVSTAGNVTQGQSFNETRAMGITPNRDVVVSALILEGLSFDSAGSVGARIYDVATQALVASGTTSVTAGKLARVEVNIAVTLLAAKPYMIGFFINTSNTSADLFLPSAVPYTVGPFNVTGITADGSDVYPANLNLAAPQMSIKTCGNGGDAGGAVDASSDASSGDSGEGGVAQCNAIILAGARIPKTTHAGPPPARTGGEVTLGTYVLTAMDKYNGTMGSNTRRETWVISAGHVEVATEDSESGNTVSHFSAGFSTTGNGVTLNGTCPASGAFSAEYTATPTQFMLLSEPLSSDQEVHVFTKQ